MLQKRMLNDVTTDRKSLAAASFAAAQEIEALPLPLMALTLRQPWATAVCDFGKRMENRTWRPPKAVLGQVIAIHAGRTFDEDGADWLAARLGKMVASKTVPSGAIIALARIQQVVTDSDDPWFVGPYGWKLSGVLPLDPVPCKGKLHLWAVPMDVHRKIQSQLEQKMSACSP